ncbi:MAG: phytoene desaturase family protein [Nesterenkonia sp.]|nr:phytoene desaturase family protein [Nesterenkonia sp.]
MTEPATTRDDHSVGRRIAIIGAGVAGLATAALLARDGHRVTVYERSETLGGRAGRIEDRGFRFDTGPSWYLMPRVFEHFFAMAGTSVDDELELVDLDPGYRVFPEPAAGRASEPVDVHADAARNRELFERLEPGAGKALADYLDSAERTSEIAERRFLYNPFTRPTGFASREVLAALPQLTTLLARSLQRYVADRFTHTVLRQILGYPAVFLGSRPEDAPAMYHLMSHLDLADGVRHPMGGFARVVDALADAARRAGAEIVTGSEVTEIVVAPRLRRRRPGAARGRVTGVRRRDADGAEHQDDADVVVSGADLHHTETALLAEAYRSRPQKWWDTRAVSGPGAVLVMLGVRGELPELAHHSLLFADDWTPQFEAIFGEDADWPETPSIYVCRPSATDPEAAPAGHENLFVLIPCPAEPGIGQGGPDGDGDEPVERMADAAVDQIAEWAGIPDLRGRIVVRHTRGPGDFAADYHSWRGGALGPAHTLGQSAMFRPQNASSRVDGLYFAGATVAPGVGVPMCLISAELVLKRLRGDHSPGPTPPQRRPGGTGG